MVFGRSSTRGIVGPTNSGRERVTIQFETRGVGGRGGAASGVDARELNEEDRIDPLDGRALATNGVRHLRLRRADDDEVEPQVSGGIEACPHLDVLAVGDVSTTLDDRVVDPVSLASTVQVRDSLPLHGGVDTSRRPGPCELQGAQPPLGDLVPP